MIKIIEETFETGQLHYRQYWLNNYYHNSNGPAYIQYYDNGQKEFEEYWINGKRHNPNGPAKVYYYRNGQVSLKVYYINDKLHNVNGPAWISYDEKGELHTKEYWMNGKRIKEEDIFSPCELKDNVPDRLSYNKKDMEYILKNQIKIIIEVDGKRYKLIPE